MDAVIARPPLPPGPFLVVGLARSGVAAALALHGRGEQVLGTDARTVAPEVKARLREIEVRDGEEGADLLAGIGTVIKSPGVPREAPLIAGGAGAGHPGDRGARAGWRLLAEHEFIGLTGSNGKTTTVELIGHIHRAAGVPVVVAGNVGTALASLPGTLEPNAVDRLRGVVVPAGGHGGVRAGGGGAAEPGRGSPGPARHVRELPRRRS